LIDQKRRKVSLSQWRGKVVVANFIYTTCALPNFCLRLANNFGVLQKRFTKELGKDVVLLTITFDPQRDTPEVLAAYAAISLAPATFWVEINKGMGVPDIQAAYAILFGQGMWTICGSIIAFLVGQLIDVVIFHRILRVTGERFVWLRATASTAVSQLLDSFIVLYIAFVIGPQHWSIPQFLAIGTVNYVYKMTAAVALIPLLYVARIGIRAYLGAGEAERLQREAASD